MSFYGDGKCNNCEATPSLVIPNFSCGLCGRDLGQSLSSFCKPCHLRQHRLTLQANYEEALGVYNRSKTHLAATKALLTENLRLQMEVVNK
jgi:hypothetical protein